MGESIRILCALSVLCGAALSLCPEGGVKRVLNIACSAALLCVIIQPISEFDYSVYALELAKNRQQEDALISAGTEFSDSLNRLVIEERYEAYILDKAEKLGLEMSGVSVTAEWSMEGLWVPSSAELRCAENEALRRELSGILEAELGIPAERQQWSGYD